MLFSLLVLGETVPQPDDVRLEDVLAKDAVFVKVLGHGLGHRGVPLRPRLTVKELQVQRVLVIEPATHLRKPKAMLIYHKTTGTQAS